MRRAASTWDVRPMNFRRALPSWAACNGCGDGSCLGRREEADEGTGGMVMSIATYRVVISGLVMAVGEKGGNPRSAGRFVG